MSLISLITRQYNKFIAIPLAQRKLKSIKILNSFSSIQYIIDNKCSVSRFGDGEFDVILGGAEGYTTPNKRLSEALKHVLTSSDAPNHMIGLPMPLKNPRTLRKRSKDFWGFFTLRNVNKILPMLSTSRTYLDTQLSRFYIIYEERTHCGDLLNLLKQIWQDKDIVIVEGKESRTGVGNDLYSNAKSIQRILGPSKDAFDVYDKTLHAIKKNVSKDKLILMSFGPCATLLAYDLAKLGYQAIDVGHLDIEYEWFRTGITTITPIKGKFTNEAGEKGKKNIEECKDKTYLSQILCDITNE